MMLDDLSPKLRNFFAAFALVGMLGLTVGCASTVEQAGDDIEDATDDAADAIEDAGDEIEDAADG